MSKEKIKNNNSKKYIVLQIIRLILIFVIIYCLVYIFFWWRENTASSNMLNEITESAVIDTTYVKIPVEDSANTDDNQQSQTNEISIPVYELDFNKLLSINNSTVGWINVPGTSINYPVVQATDNSFYLTHSFDKSKNKAGWIFADYRNKFNGLDKNIIFYGHNRMDNSMFASLRNTQKANWYNNKSNQYMTFTTPSGPAIYQVFSVYTIKAETYYLTTDFADDNDFLNYANAMKNRSVYNFGVTLTKDDSILTLSTCDASGKSRVILHAKKINS